jgi:hypothetical protein
MFKRIPICLVILVLLTTACKPAVPSPSESQFLAARDYNAAPQATVVAEEVKGAGAPGEVPAQAERIVIKNATLSIAVDSPEKSMKTISDMAEDMGGFVVNARLFQTTLSSGAEVLQASITVRVPAERLGEALDRIKAETTKDIINESLDSQDVTSDYVDLQSRLRNLEAAEKQLQKIMDQATKTEDVLDVYNQLKQTREQIEVIKGRIQFYDQASALSEISVELIANEAVQPLKVGKWEIGGEAKKAAQTLLNTLRSLTYAVEWIVILVIPLLICIVLPIAVVFLIVRFILRRRKRKVQPPAP